jgi:putative glutamine amidotransferase
MSAPKSRPRIAVLGRFAAHTSNTPLPSIVVAENVAQAIWDAGGEPLILLPVPDSDWNQRLEGVSGILLPGGADLDPSNYGATERDPSLYGLNLTQDSVDVSLAKFSLEQDIPLLAICRGHQLINVVRGGTLIQDMPKNHRDTMHEVSVQKFATELGLSTAELLSSCYHHQAVDEIGKDLEPIAFSEDGTIEAFKIHGVTWGYTVQWHPEHNYLEESGQLQILKAFVYAAAQAPTR